MSFPKSQKSRSAKIEFKCYKCRDACSAKDGDWHSSPVAGSHQVFLCRECERDAKVGHVKSLSPLY